MQGYLGGMTENIGTPGNSSATPPAGGVAMSAAGRHIMKSLLVVVVCGLFLRFGSLIVSMAISHLWAPSAPARLAYLFIFRQVIMAFIYPSVLNIFRPAFIPLYNEVKRREGPAAAAAFARGVLQVGMLLGCVAAGLLWGFPEYAVHFLAPDFAPEVFAETVRMMRQMAPGILFLLWAEMYMIFFQAEKSFGVPHGAEAAHKIAWGLAIVAAGKLLGWPAQAIGLGYSAACLLQLGINLYGMRRHFGWVLPLASLRSWAERWGRPFALLVLPLLVGILGARWRDLITHQLQSGMEAVRYDAVEFARQLATLPVGFLGQIVSTVMLPHLAAILQENGAEAHRRTLEKSIETLALLTLPVVAAILVLAPEMMALVFVKAGWSEAEFVFCAQGALAMRLIALGMIFMILENVLMPGLFSIQSMWWPVLWGLAASLFQVLCMGYLGSLELERTSMLLFVGVVFVYPLTRILKNGILLLVLRRQTGLFSGWFLVTTCSRLWLFFVFLLAAMFAAHKLATVFLGGIPATAPLFAYKATLALHLAVPPALVLPLYAFLLSRSSYRVHLAEAVALIRRRNKAAAK